MEKKNPLSETKEILYVPYSSLVIVNLDPPEHTKT